MSTSLILRGKECGKRCEKEKKRKCGRKLGNSGQEAQLISDTLSTVDSVPHNTCLPPQSDLRDAPAPMAVPLLPRS